MKQNLLDGAALMMALAGCQARDEGNGSTVISVDRNAVDSGLDQAGDAVKDAGNEVKEAADKAAPALENAADKAGSAVSNAAERTGEAADRAGDKAENAADSTRVTVTTNSTEERR